MVKYQAQQAATGEGYLMDRQESDETFGWNIGSVPANLYDFRSSHIEQQPYVSLQSLEYGYYLTHSQELG